MPVQGFIKWSASAPVSRRAAAANALARAYQQARFNEDQLPEVEAALTMLLDDPSPKVRGAIAGPLSRAAHVPMHVLMALAGDQPQVASEVIAHSPLLGERQLIELVVDKSPATQRIVAGRARLTAPVSAALAEHGDADACRRLLDNDSALIADRHFLRMAERFGGEAAMRTVLLDHPRIPAHVRHELIARLSRILCGSQLVLASIGEARAERLAQDTGRVVSIRLIDRSPPGEFPALAARLIEKGEMTIGFLIELVAGGRMEFLAVALAALSGISRARVDSLLGHGGAHALGALFLAAGLPDEFRRAALPAIGLWRDTVRGKRIAGPQETSWLMLQALSGETDGLGGEIADLLRAIHGGYLRASARSRAEAITAMHSNV